MTIRFTLGADILAKRPDYTVAVVVARQVDNTKNVEAAATYLKRAVEEVRVQQVDESDEQLRAWQAAFRELGINPAAYPTAVARLLKRACSNEDVSSINPAVDFANAISLRYRVPIGVHDLESIRRDMAVRLAQPGDTFVTYDSSVPESVPVGEPVYAHEHEVRTRRWVWRQSQIGRATPQSHLLFFPIDGLVGSQERLLTAARELADLLTRHLGAHTAVHLLDCQHPQCVLLRYPLVSRVPRDGDAIDELLGRGVIDLIKREEIEPRLRNGERLNVKLGIDPTSPRLHLGRATRLFKLREFQQLGHTVQFVIGSFTGMLGDPSDKKAERQQLTREQVQRNMDSYAGQAGKILDLSKTEIFYNADWLAPLTFADVIELAANFTVQQMIERENFHDRFVAGRPIHLHELLYPLLQGQDSVVLHSDVELGGTDQLFNMLAGRILQERAGQRPQVVMTGPLIPGTNGEKMSSSVGNVIDLLDSPRDQYFSLMRMHDDIIVTYFETCTAVPLSTIRDIAEQLESDQLNPRDAKALLARTIVTQFHSAEAAHQAEQEFEQEVRRHEQPQNIPDVTVPAGERRLADFLREIGLVESRASARRLIEQGGVSVNGTRATLPQASITPEDGMLIRVGKSGWARLRLSTTPATATP